jgi:D-3-phosphoglycerate dehydrogenase
MKDLPLVIQAEPIDEDAMAWLASRAQLVDVSGTEARIAPALREAEGLVVRTYTIVDRSLLDLAPRLRVVGRAGVGLDNIDVAECRTRGIEVVYTPDANTQAVVEYVLALMCGAMRPLHPVTRALAPEAWARIRAEVRAARQMSEATLGILGLGRIGRRVAQVAAAIGFKVLYNDLLDLPPATRFGADAVDPAVLFARSDVLSIHIDGRPSNDGFVGAALVERMKNDVVFINTSRGFVVDNAALARFLLAHPEARAHLDVHEPEPFDDAYPLLGVAGATLYPHLAARTTTAMREMSWVVRDVAAVLDGRAPRWPAPRVTE